MESNKVKKAVSRPPDYLQFPSSSSASGSTNEGNHPDRGPSGTGLTTKPCKLLSGASGSGGSPRGLMASSVNPGCYSLTTPAGFHPAKSYSIESLNMLIQNGVLQVPTAAKAFGAEKGASDSEAAIPDPVMKSNAAQNLVITTQIAPSLYAVAASTSSVGGFGFFGPPKPAKGGSNTTSSSQNSSTRVSNLIKSIPSTATCIKGHSSPTLKNNRLPATVRSKTFLNTDCESTTHWEIQSAKRSSVIRSTAKRVDQLHRIKSAAATCFMDISSRLVMGIQPQQSTSGPLKPNLNKRKPEVELTRKIAKRRKCASSVAAGQKETTPVTKQWPNLLSSVLQKLRSTTIGETPQFTNSATNTSTSSIVPIPNSLLIKYDPIKILNRPSLLATLKSSKANIESSIQTVNQSTIQPPLRKAKQPSSQPVVSNSRASGSSQIHQQCSERGQQLPNKSLKTKTHQPSSQKQQKQVETASMPPPKLPPPWSAKKKVDGKSRVVLKSNFRGHQPSTSSTVGSSNGTNTQRCNPQLPYLLPKLNLGVPSGAKKRSLEVAYEAESPKVSSLRLRLTTVAFTKRVVKRNRIKRLIREGKLREPTKRSVGNIPKSRKPANSNTVTSEPTDPAMPKKTLSRSKSLPTENKDLPAANSSIKTGDNPGKKKQILRKKNPNVIVTIAENPLVDHAIELLQEKRELQKRLELIEDEGIIYRLKPLPKLKTPIPKGQFLEHNIPLSATQTKTVLQKRLTVLLAHGGFTHANLQPLEVLADVMENFYQKMAHRLKQVVEMEMSGCGQEFPDALERVMVEMGVGGVRGCEEFYQTRVVDYRKRLEEQCIALRDEYSKNVRLKVGKGYYAPGGCNSSSSSTSTSCQPLSPGNSVLAEILSGLEEPTASLPPCDESRTSFQQSRPPILIPKKGQQQQQQPLPATAPKLQLPCTSLSRPANLNIQNPIRNPFANPLQSPTPTAVASSIGSPSQLKPCPSPMSISARSGKPKSVTIMQGGGNSSSSPTSSSSMVSINLNNNLDLGGFPGMRSSGINTSTSVNTTAGINVSGSNSNSKAKLKEALSQRNLLRLNFEQAPTSCDSTVLLSSSSPSLSTSSATNKNNK